MYTKIPPKVEQAFLTLGGYFKNDLGIAIYYGDDGISVETSHFSNNESNSYLVKSYEFAFGYDEEGNERIDQWIEE